MDKQPTVVFRNVGQLYFPQSRVECHYSLTSDHQWSSGDWIGIFEMDCSSVKQYHTYTWAVVPEGYTRGSGVNCCALFQASYLPRPSGVEYQFVYVDSRGEVCARSRSFTFRSPKPLEELETLREEQDEEDGEEELQIVIPRAQLLQSQLEECLKKQANLLQALDEAKEEKENEKKNSNKAREEWESHREAMKEELSQLTDNMRLNCEMLKKMEGKHNVEGGPASRCLGNVKYSQENLTFELSKLMAEKAESQQRVRDLEENIKVLNDRKREEHSDLERLKERVKKMSIQMNHDEEKRKCLQVENQSALAEVRGLQERLEASEHAAEGLRRELRELGTRHGQTSTELHQARLQAAQLTLLLSEENLVLREERATWALEREAYKHAAERDSKKLQELSCEVQKKEEWLQEERMEREKLEVELGQERDCNRVLLRDARQELQELKASVRTAQKESEEQQVDKQEPMNYTRQFNGGIPAFISSGSSSEDDTDASSASSASSRSTGSPLFRSTQSDQPNRAELLAAETHTRRQEDAAASDSQRCGPPAGGGKLPMLPEPVDPVLSEPADSPMW
ncbi:calcium-binding and coiled-coil domain-containing protein 1-like isoform X2 [Pungitius pungitius]|uniref:calcium-binding and coiled-coil domain-containing protein 1-like isoform X2 n=1 Tax=Pungitius pungitius TaxID=134920 RepID=UPI002E1607EE